MKALIIEGRYDSLVTKLSNKLLSIIKDSWSATQDAKGRFAGKKIYFKQGESVPEILDDEQQRHIYFNEVEALDIPIEFYLQLKVQWIEGLNDLQTGGDAYNETKPNSGDLPLIEIRFKIDPAEYPQILSEVAINLRDVLRHELEHLTQSGWNTIDGKYIRSDQALRTKIETGELPPSRYFTLPKEIDAMIQGLYYRAKKSKQPFAHVVDNYLNIWVDNGTLTTREKEAVLKVWRSRLPKLAIRQEL